MKIAHFSYSSFGGAGKVAKLLHKFQKDQGFDSHFYSLTDSNLHSISSRFSRLLYLAACDKYILSRGNNPSLFSFMRSYHSGLNTDSIPKDFDVIHFHWIPGLLRIKQLSELFSPNVNFIWSIQDFWPMTGGCHFVGSCTGYVKNCKNCPQLRGGFQNLAQKQLDEKIVMLSPYKSNMTLVAPSRFVEKKIRSSSIFRDFRTTIIGNPVNSEKADFKTKLDTKYYSNKKASFVIGCVAADLSEVRKNIPLLITWFLLNHKKFGIPLKLLLVGNNADFIEPHPNIEVRSNIQDYGAMKALYEQMDINISLSAEETFGYTVVEAGVQGVATICVNGTAQSELITNNVNGILLESIDDLNSAIEKLLFSNEFRIAMSLKVRSDYLRNFSISNIGAKYLKIYTR